MMMRIGVISDTHLKGVSKELQEIFFRYLGDAEMILHAGDFVSLEIVSFLGQKDFYGVCGNMDPPEVKRILPHKRLLKLGEWKIGLIHGWGGPEGIEERIRGEFPDTDVIVYGHSHRSANHTTGGTLFFNPGAAMGFSSDGRHSIGVLTVGERIQGEIIYIGS
ncbi:MAG: metallophosphoesterase family protein [Desulfatiglandales bacterium]